MTALKRAGLVLLGLFVILLSIIGILSMTRGTPVHSVIVLGSSGLPPAVGDSLFARTMELHAKTHIDPGNSVELLSNGDGTFPRLWADISSAKQSLTLQMYFAAPGSLADTLAARLIERARAKVRVLLLFDAFGSSDIKQEWMDRLRAAGVEAEWLRPLHWYALDKANNRSHVRAIVVDGRIGYTGGFGFADKWLGDGLRDDQWRETNVRFEGPVVTQLQATFAAAWAEAKGELLAGDLFFPRATLAAVGPVQAGLLYASPTLGSTTAERFMALSIASARRTLYITNAYVVPDDDFRRMLTDAVARGVDVRVLTNGDKSDVMMTTYATRARYGELLRGGVRIYEYLPTTLHSKTFVVDALWSTVGSMNFDNRSLALNDESNLVSLDSTLGAALVAMFESDLKHAKEITLEEHNRRPWKERVFETASNLLSRLL